MQGWVRVSSSKASWRTMRLTSTAGCSTYFRLLCDYVGQIDFGGEKVELGGETIIEYMVFDRRRGVAPKDKPFKHFLHV